MLSELGAKYYAIELDQVGECSMLEVFVNLPSYVVRFGGLQGYTWQVWRAADG